MNIHELTLKFAETRDYSPGNMNELLDFAKMAYVHNEINILDYRNLVRELEIKGASTPDDMKQSC
ncbi:YppF family protein [Mesobacillus zeae]|uniref:YppF-like protein n=1 Tax=Mesobacillus zeae TaxID=1917180 RepID=A0A398B8H4_9BACI|nr:YppF family protein [Mesobacillus zeae]RID84210.1 hypothetical protein D1970_13940 [Mesobacillus zeae]